MNNPEELMMDGSERRMEKILGALSGSREPNPQAVSALTGFDPGRVEAISSKAFRIRKIAAELGRDHPDIPELDAIYILAAGIVSTARGSTGRRKA
jgi:hypothetical protein